MPLIHLLIHPAFHGSLLLVCWIFFQQRGRIWGARIALGGLIGWMLLVFILPLPDYLAERMERQFHSLDISSLDTTQTYRIMVLGAGKISDPALPATSQLGEVVLMRLVEGVRLYYQLPASTVVTSASALNSLVPQAKTVADAAVLLGVLPSDTLQLSTPETTRTEAAAYLDRFQDDTPVVLVTSALHMPRAVKWFRSQGITVIPAPCDFKVKRDPAAPFRFPPYLHGLSLLSAVFHEYAGHFQHAFVSRF